MFHFIQVDEEEKSQVNAQLEERLRELEQELNTEMLARKDLKEKLNTEMLAKKNLEAELNDNAAKFEKEKNDYKKQIEDEMNEHRQLIEQEKEEFRQQLEKRHKEEEETKTSKLITLDHNSFYFSLLLHTIVDNRLSLFFCLLFSFSTLKS